MSDKIESEFDKQINKHLTEEVGTAKWAITTENLYKVLDAARADMPRAYTEESKTETVTLASGKVMPALYVHSSEVEDWEKWAKRWFGGAP